MPLQSSDASLVSRPIAPTQEDGPVLDGPPHGGEGADPTLRIRARRLYAVSREELFATWTRRTAWDVWMRLRARSRASLAPYRGGGFRLELAEGPAIHVIVGALTEFRSPELLTLSWHHQNTNDPGSVVEISFRRHQSLTELSLSHTHIASRREAAWLMRLWSTVLGRLGTYVAEGQLPSVRRQREAEVMAPTTEPASRGTEARAAFARSAGIALTIGALAFQPASAQIATDSARAAAPYFAGQWSEAAKGYETLVRADTTNVVNWYRYGVSLEELGRYKDALGALRHAARAKAPVLANQVHFRFAKAHAGLGARDSAAAHLDAAAGGGFRLWETVRDDADFAAMRNDAGFVKSLGRIENNRYPCRAAPEHRQLDYWVGDWNVVNGPNLLGTNRIELLNGDCILQENWAANGNGGGGKSWSYYDPSIKKWKQLFIFDNGASSELVGEMQNGAMRFERAIPATANAPASITRMTFFPIAKDSVRQFIESSTDGGTTWQPSFNGMYVRKRGTA